VTSGTKSPNLVKNTGKFESLLTFGSFRGTFVVNVANSAWNGYDNFYKFFCSKHMSYTALCGT
jgi:hypothetical protein